ncbi:MAG: hypothetical protein HGA97_01360 [Chlorobiaceae bacterium]|nr:hypothetical protein [Chlorobiaceae bacterium]
MAKAKKEEQNSKPRVRIGIMNTLFILAGADFILLLAPQYGLLNSMFFIGDLITWSALLSGIVLLLLGFRGVYRKK